MPYIPLDIETEPIDFAGDAYSYLGELIPGWLPSPGNLEAWLIESLAQLAGELAALAALVPEAIFRFFGESILGLPPYAATSAQAVTTWTMVDGAGYSVPAGTVIAVTPPASNDSWAFTVDEGFTLVAGQTQAFEITATALLAGAAASGLTGQVAVIDPLTFVQSVTLAQPTSGGQDAETDADYLDRLSDLLTLLSPRPILAPDFAVLARRMVPGVARATAIDLYDPTTGLTNRPRCVTVAVCDDAGEPCSPEVKQEVDDLLQSMREVNFLVYVIDPTYTTIDVTVGVFTLPGYDPVDVAQAVVDRLTAYLSPSQWGLPPYGDPGTQSWVNQTKVRYLELTEQANRVDGVDYVSTLTFGVTGTTLARVDVTLPGPAPLTRPGTIAATGYPPH